MILWITFILCIITIGVEFKYIGNITKIKFHPLMILSTIWIFVFWGVFATIQFRASIGAIIIYILILISGALTITLCCFHKKKDKQFSTNEFLRIIGNNYNVLMKTLIICMVFRCLQLVYDAYVLKKLGVSVISIFGDSQPLRQAYLNYSSSGMSFIAVILSNVLNYFAEFGIVLSAIISSYKKKYFTVICSLILALLHSTLTLSKMAFFLDVCFVISTFMVTLNYNIISGNKKKEKEDKKNRTKLIIFMGVAIIGLLVLTSIQRGYGESTALSDNIRVTFEKAIAYFITPSLAFLKVLDMNITYSFGTKTFNVLLKLLGYNFENFGAIDVGSEDSTVYTMSGMFYADFSYFGAILLTVLTIVLCNHLYYRVYGNFKLSRLVLFISINTILMMSFFTWMGRITFFWSYLYRLIQYL